MASQSPESSQGELFEVLLENTGTTDPGTPRTITAHFVTHAEGIFTEMDEPTPSVIDLDQPTVTAVVHAEVAKRKRHQAQLGKHSPLQRDGTYLSVRPGDVLPDFGIVTLRNRLEAQAHAEQLEAKRTQR